MCVCVCVCVCIHIKMSTHRQQFKGKRFGSKCYNTSGWAPGVLKCWVNAMFHYYSYLRLKSQWVSDMDLVLSIARDIVGAAVDLESVSGIIKYTFNLSACTENDLWMNFKQHASFCNLPNEPCGSDLRSDAQHRAKRFFYFYYFPNRVKFQDTVCKRIHILPLCLWEVLSWNTTVKSYYWVLQ